jgi:hypothetical protein
LTASIAGAGRWKDANPPFCGGQHPGVRSQTLIVSAGWMCSNVVPDFYSCYKADSLLRFQHFLSRVFFPAKIIWPVSKTVNDKDQFFNAYISKSKYFILIPFLIKTICP